MSMSCPFQCYLRLFWRSLFIFSNFFFCSSVSTALTFWFTFSISARISSRVGRVPSVRFALDSLYMAVICFCCLSVRLSSFAMFATLSSTDILWFPPPRCADMVPAPRMMAKAKAMIFFMMFLSLLTLFSLLSLLTLLTLLSLFSIYMTLWNT